MSVSVESHYGNDRIVELICAAVDQAGGGKPGYSAQDFYPYDQFHGRGLLATRDHAAALAPLATDHVLDIGSGVGGPARYVASTFGCRVTGIDLTPGFVAAATDLTGLCGLADRVAFQRADAAALPFDNSGFDCAMSFYVGMNLPDTSAVLREAARVLRPGGRLIWSQVVSTGAPPHFPLPWARSADISHLDSRDDLCAAFQSAGFADLDITDESALYLAAPPAPGPALTGAQIEANAVVLGADFIERRKNYIRSMAEGRIASLLIMATASG
jgi:SAM-dependent methyltransferase